MKRLLTLVFAITLLTILTGAGTAQRRSDAVGAPIEITPVGIGIQGPAGPVLSCCECLGKVTTLNLSTGQSGPNDPLWTVNATPAHPTSAYPGWIATTNAMLNPAKWIQFPNQSTPASNVPAGNYKYSVRFTTPRCVIPSTITLEGYFAADNSASVVLDGTNIPTTACSTNCFNVPQAPVHFTVTVPSTVSHTLDFVVNNLGGPSALVANVKVTRKCASNQSGAAVEVDPQ